MLIMNKSEITLRNIFNYISSEHPALLEQKPRHINSAEHEFDKTLESLLYFVAHNFALELAPKVINQYRKAISKIVAEKFNWTVSFGPLNGLVLARDSSWNIGDFGSMIIGTYEIEVLEVIISLSKKYKIFIDIGAADGFYGVGLIRSGYFEKSICFEISEKGQASIKQLAKMNGCLEKIQIFGEANAQSLTELSRDEHLEALVLIDIEGVEFELLSEEVLKLLRRCSIIVEIHDFSVHEGNRKYIDLTNRVTQFFDVTTVTTTSRDLSNFPEFEDFSDHARWLLVSEGRGKRMTWLVMSPK